VLLTTVAVTKLHASRPRKDFNFPPPLTALLALLRCEFCAVFTRLCSSVHFATLYDFAVTMKHAIWWRPLYPHRSSVDTAASYRRCWRCPGSGVTISLGPSGRLGVRNRRWWWKCERLSTILKNKQCKRSNPGPQVRCLSLDSTVSRTYTERRPIWTTLYARKKNHFFVALLGYVCWSAKRPTFPPIFNSILVLQIALFVQAFLILGNLPCFLRMRTSGSVRVLMYVHISILLMFVSSVLVEITLKDYQVATEIQMWVFTNT
jgi:hypothetical protein